MNQTKALKIALFLNFAAFIIEVSCGIIFNSLGLLEDGFDMLADAFIYAIGLWTVGKSLQQKKNVAKIMGYLQSGLTLFAFYEVLKRFFGHPVMPNFKVMISVSVIALIINITSIIVLQKIQQKEINIKASIICSSNDVLTNLGVIIAAIFVSITNSFLPDLIIGIIVLALVFKGIVEIFELAK